jgi:hypothetical protein
VPDVSIGLRGVRLTSGLRSAPRRLASVDRRIARLVPPSNGSLANSTTSSATASSVHLSQTTRYLAGYSETMRVKPGHSNRTYARYFNGIVASRDMAGGCSGGGSGSLRRLPLRHCFCVYINQLWGQRWSKHWSNQADSKPFRRLTWVRMPKWDSNQIPHGRRPQTAPTNRRPIHHPISQSSRDRSLYRPNDCPADAPGTIEDHRHLNLGGTGWGLAGDWWAGWEMSHGWAAADLWTCRMRLEISKPAGTVCFSA